MSNLAQKVAGRQSGTVIIASGIRARLHWLTTVTVCWTWVTAAWYRVSPAWLASRMQVPGLLKVTVDPEIEHTEPLAESMLKITGLPDAPPVAVTV